MISFRKSLLVLGILVLFTSMSHANLKKGRITDGNTRVFEFSTFSAGFSTLILLFDSSSADLDLGIADDEGNLIAAGFSEQRFLELLQAGLPAGQTFLVIVDSFRGGGRFRLIVNNSEQGVIGAAGVESEIGFKEVPMSPKARKLRDQLRELASKHKK